MASLKLPYPLDKLTRDFQAGIAEANERHARGEYTIRELFEGAVDGDSVLEDYVEPQEEPKPAPLPVTWTGANTWPEKTTFWRRVPGQKAMAKLSWEECLALDEAGRLEVEASVPGVGMARVFEA